MPYLPVLLGIGAAIGTATFFYHNRELIQDFIDNFEEIKTLLENKRAHRLAASSGDSPHTIYDSREMELESHDSDSDLTETELESVDPPGPSRDSARASGRKAEYEGSDSELRNRMTLSMPSSANSTQSLDFETPEMNSAFESDYSIISEDGHSDA